MNAPTLPARHRMAEAHLLPERTDARRPSRTHLSSTGWARLRRAFTTAIFVAATVIGVTVGVRAVDVSPVAPAVAISQPATPAAAPAAAPATVPTTAQPPVRADQGADPAPGPGRNGRGGRPGGGSR